MNIAGLPKAQILAALYNRAKVQGLGYLDPSSSKPMSEKQAQEYLDNTPNGYFDYLQGRVMKINLSKDEVDARLYNRDNGEGAAEEIISKMMETR